MELVSVIIPAYNAEKTLENALISVCRQTYRDLEIIVVNDGSSDRTQVIADRMRETDQRVVVHHIKNKGVSNARNTALKTCHGRFVAFADADDIMEETMIENLARHMIPGIDLVCCGYKVRDMEGKVLFQQKPVEGLWLYDKLYLAIDMLQSRKCMNMVWNKLFRADMIRAGNLRMDPRVSMGEDLLFVMEYLKHCTGGIYITSKSSYCYTLSGGGLQFTANREDNLRRRLDQLKKLHAIYNDRNYPADGICMEILRCFYTSIMEAENPSETVKEIYLSDQYSFLIERPLKCGIKYRMFLRLLQSQNRILIIGAVRIFRFFKRAGGKAFQWPGG